MSVNNVMLFPIITCKYMYNFQFTIEHFFPLNTQAPEILNCESDVDLNLCTSINMGNG